MAHGDGAAARAAKEKEQGDGIPAGEDAEDADQGADEPDEDTPVDPVAKMDAENQKLRVELDAARQSFKSERAAKEEVQDALHRLRADITRVLCTRRRRCGTPCHATTAPEPPETRAEEPEPETAQ